MVVVEAKIFAHIVELFVGQFDLMLLEYFLKKRRNHLFLESNSISIKIQSDHFISIEIQLDQLIRIFRLLDHLQQLSYSEHA